MFKISNKLYFSNLKQVQDKNQLLNLKITHILSCCKSFEHDLLYKDSKEFIQKVIPVLDVDTENYFKYLVLIMSKDKNNIIGIILNILFLTRITR